MMHKEGRTAGGSRSGRIAIGFAALVMLLALAVPQQAISADRTSWTKRVEVARGETAEIQVMYNIDSRTCEWHEKPPKPRFRTAPTLGEVAFRKGTTAPHQCPSKVIDAHIAHYTAGNRPGTDKFQINWKSTEGQRKVFRVTYIVNVK